MTDFRALCAELVEALDCWIEDEFIRASDHDRQLVDRARAALAQPEPQGPTDKELCETYSAAYYACENRQGPAAQTFALRAVLTRWGNR